MNMKLIPAFSCALVLHVALFFVFFTVHEPSVSPASAAAASTPTIDAVAVDSKQIAAEVQQLKQRDKQARLRRQRERARAKRLARKTKQRLQALHREEKRLHAKIAKAKRLAKQQRLEAANRARLAKAREKREALKKAALASQRQREQQQLLQRRQQLMKTVAKTAMISQKISEIDRYKALIVAAISAHWLMPPNIDSHASCELQVQLAPGGVILGVKVVRPSADVRLDRSSRSAVLQSSPLPVPSDSKLFEKFRTLRLTVRPEGVVT